MRTALTFSLLALALTGCGQKAELYRYTVNVAIAAPSSLSPAQVPHHELLGCTNAEVFDETLIVYDGLIANPVAAIRFQYTGFDLSEGGENTETVLLADGATLTVNAALDESLALYTIDWKGRMRELDKDVARVKRSKRAEAGYALGAGDGLEIAETHELSNEVDPVQFIEEGAFNCDLTQL